MVCIMFSSIRQIDFSWKCSFKTFEKKKVLNKDQRLTYYIIAGLFHASRHYCNKWF